MKGLIYRIWRLAITLAIVWFIGFFIFITFVFKNPPAHQLKADGIVVLTGGKFRIGTGLELLRKKYAGRMLISGVNKQISARELKKSFKGYDDLFNCCVEFDYAAANTRQNAIESQKWADQYKLKSLIIVSSNYHMPRTMIEFSRLLKDHKLIAYPVVRSPFLINEFWRNFNVVRVLFSEYTKAIPAFAQLIWRRITGSHTHEKMGQGAS